MTDDPLRGELVSTSSAPNSQRRTPRTRRALLGDQRKAEPRSAVGSPSVVVNGDDAVLVNPDDEVKLGDEISLVGDQVDYLQAGLEYCFDLSGTTACGVPKDVTSDLGNALDAGSLLIECHDGVDTECGLTAAMIVIDYVGATALTPPVYYGIKAAGHFFMIALGALQDQTPNIPRTDWPNVPPGDLPYQGGVGIIPGFAPDGTNTGTLHYGGPDCAASVFYNEDYPGCG